MCILQEVDPNFDGFFGALIGALLTALASVGLFLYQTHQQNKKEEEGKIKQEKDLLKYFVVLIQDIIDAMERQVVALNEYGDFLNENPTNLTRRMKVIITENLNRVIDKFDHQKLFHAYMNSFDNDPNRAEVFKKIFSRLDFIQKNQNQIREIYKLFAEDTFTNYNKYKNVAEEEVLSYCVSLLNQIRQNDPNYQQNDFWVALNGLLLNYGQNRPIPITLEYMQENFLLPTRETMVNRFRHITEADYIANNCRKAIWIYNTAVLMVKRNGEDFKRYAGSIEEVNNELKELTQDLISE